MRIIEIDMKQTRIVTLRISKTVNDRIEKIVKKRGYPSKSDFIRLAIIEFLNNFEKTHVPSVSDTGPWNRSDEGRSDTEFVNNPNLVIIY